MSHTFLAMLEEIDAAHDRISKELRGSTFHLTEEVSANGKKKRTVEIEVEPPKEAFFKRSNTLNHIILKFYPHARIMTSAASTLLTIWTSEIMDAKSAPIDMYLPIFALLQKLLKTIYTNEASLSSRVIAWRKPLREKFGADSDVYVMSMNTLGIRRERAQALRDEYTANVREAVRERKTADFTEGDVLRTIRNAARSKEAPANIMAVLLATGSRLIECIKVSDYIAEEKDPSVIRVVGVAKDRGTQPKVIVRPLIGLESDEVIRLVTRIRKAHDFSSLSNEKATGKVDAQVNKVAAEAFGEGVTAHKLRYIWASLAYQKFGGDVPEQEWLREMLGHASADTSLTYTQMTVRLGEPVRGGGMVVHTDLVFPQFANPPYVRIGKEEQLRLLQQLNDAYKGTGRRMLQKDAKSHRFGSAVVNEFWKRRYAEF